MGFEETTSQRNDLAEGLVPSADSRRDNSDSIDQSCCGLRSASSLLAEVHSDLRGNRNSDGKVRSPGDVAAPARIATNADSIAPARMATNADSIAPAKVAVDADSIAPKQSERPEQTTASPAANKPKPSEVFEQGNAKLLELHANLPITKDGSAPKILQPGVEYLAERQRPIDIARRMLGDSASAEQLAHYTRTLVESNEIKSGPNQPHTGVLRLPGQDATGAVVTKQGDQLRRTWSDGSSMVSDDLNVQGTIQLTDRDGTSRTYRWNSIVKGAELVTEEKGDHRHTKDGNGLELDFARQADGTFQRVRARGVASTGTVIDEKYEPGQLSPYEITLTDKDGSVTNLRIDGSNGSTYTGRKVDKDGNVLIANLAMTQSGVLYERDQITDPRTGDTLKTRRLLSNDQVEMFNNLDQMVGLRFKDNWGRTVYKEFNSQDQLVAQTLHLPGREPIRFEAQRSGALRSDWKDESGKKIGTIALGKDGQVIFTNKEAKTVRTEFPDGSVEEVLQHGSGTKEVRLSKSEFTGVNRLDWRDQLLERQLKYRNGREVTHHFTDGNLDRIAIKEADGSLTDVRYDAAERRFEGERKDASGKVVETVRSSANGLRFYYTANDGTMRAEFYKRSEPDSYASAARSGIYHADAGVIETAQANGTKKRESIEEGRTDIIRQDGTIEGTTSTKLTSFVKPTGEARIEFRDGRGLHLHADGKTVDLFRPDALKITGQLAPEEAEYLARHPDVDRRDVLALNLKFRNKPEQRAAFYQQLNAVDTMTTLDDQQKSNLRRNIMHHVGYPAEIAQADSPTCNVAVLQRHMAMQHPAVYARYVIDALDKGRITTADGRSVPVNNNNLEEVDTSNRDLATRAFAGLSYQALFHPRFEFVNEGHGEITIRHGEDRYVRNGITMSEISELMYRLSGENKAVVVLDDTRDLFSAFKHNGREPMILMVDGNKGPVGSGEGLGPHVVTVTDINERTSKVYFQNQWGLINDHSEDATAVSADALSQNTRFIARRVDTRTQFRGIALVEGDRNKAYRFDEKSQLVEDKVETNAVHYYRRRLIAQNPDRPSGG